LIIEEVLSRERASERGNRNKCKTKVKSEEGNIINNMCLQQKWEYKNYGICCSSWPNLKSLAIQEEVNQERYVLFLPLP